MNEIEKRIYEALLDHKSEGEMYAYVVRVKDSPSEDKTFLHCNDAIKYSLSFGERATPYAFAGSFTELK